MTAAIGYSGFHIGHCTRRVCELREVCDGSCRAVVGRLPHTDPLWMIAGARPPSTIGSGAASPPRPGEREVGRDVSLCRTEQQAADQIVLVVATLRSSPRRSTRWVATTATRTRPKRRRLLLHPHRRRRNRPTTTGRWRRRRRSSPARAIAAVRERHPPAHHAAGVPCPSDGTVRTSA
jgi:hypothetical protein